MIKEGTYYINNPETIEVTITKLYIYASLLGTLLYCVLIREYWSITGYKSYRHHQFIIYIVFGWVLWWTSQVERGLVVISIYELIIGEPNKL